MIEVISAEHVSTGWVHALVFEGALPTWDEIHAVAYQGASHDRLAGHTLFKNKLTDSAVMNSAKMWAGDYAPVPSRIVLGTGLVPAGQTGPLSSDFEMWQPDETTSRVLDLRTVFMTIYSEYGVTYQTDEINDNAYTEVGLFDSEGVLWAHAVINLTKTASQTCVILWKVQHVGN